MSWHEQLSDEYQGNDTLANIPDLDTLAKSYLDSQTYIGGSIRVPGEDAGDEDWTSFNNKLLEKVPGMLNLPKDEAEANAMLFQKLGRPESADKYSVATDASAEQIEFMKWAWDNGMSDAQVKNWFKANEERQSSSSDQLNSELSQQEEALKAEWGQGYQRKLADAKNAIKAYADDQVNDFLENTGLGDHPMIQRLLASAGANLGEEQTAGISDGNNRFAYTPTEAQARIREIQRNPDHEFNNPRSQGYRDAVAHVQNLYQMAFPDPS